jgi:GH24 family phage-related lysozyme (muramidase)
MYLDSVGLVTSGVGALLDDGKGRAPAACLALPWTDGGHLASQVEIITAWDRVKARQDLAPRGGSAFRDVTTLRISEQTINGLLTAKTLEFWSVLSAQLVDLEEWPADAQLGLIDLSYQVGPRFLGPAWPNFTRAAHARDFPGCAENSAVRQASVERNGHRKRLFTNAAQVDALGIDPAVLWDRTTPVKEDEVLSDDDIRRIAKAVAAEIKAPSAAAIAAEVLSRDGLIDNVNIHPTGGDQVTLATALEELHRKVNRLK